jgi:hypothetical protein
VKKIGPLLVIFFACPLIAAFYGILHDEITFTISPEYYTRFKFISFDIAEGMHKRLGAAIVGMSAAWWTGIPIGIIVSAIGLIHYDNRSMLKFGFQSIGIVLITAMIFGIAGYFYGKYFLAGRDAMIPEGLADAGSYLTAGSIHNFSYMGGAIGIFAGAYWQVRQKRKMKMKNG